MTTRSAASRRRGVKYILGTGPGPALSGAGGLVVLASCLTDVTEADLRRGAHARHCLPGRRVRRGRGRALGRRGRGDRTVYERLPPELNGRHPDPAAALRAAQLWLLDPDRVVPGGWPNRSAEEATLAGARWSGLGWS